MIRYSRVPGGNVTSQDGGGEPQSLGRIFHSPLFKIYACPGQDYTRFTREQHYGVGKRTVILKSSNAARF